MPSGIRPCHGFQWRGPPVRLAWRHDDAFPESATSLPPVAFDTTSRGSNSAHRMGRGFPAPARRRTCARAQRAGRKTNLWARLGPDGRAASCSPATPMSCPSTASPGSHRPVGHDRARRQMVRPRPTDMKGFIALSLAHAETISKLPLKGRSISRFSYDEEVGCAGVEPMIAEIGQAGAPAVVWVGEPTLWGVLSAHKGIRDYEVGSPARPRTRPTRAWAPPPSTKRSTFSRRCAASPASRRTASPRVPNSIRHGRRSPSARSAAAPPPTSSPANAASCSTCAPCPATIPTRCLRPSSPGRARA